MASSCSDRLRCCGEEKQRGSRVQKASDPHLQLTSKDLYSLILKAFTQHPACARSAPRAGPPEGT